MMPPSSSSHSFMPVSCMSAEIHPILPTGARAERGCVRPLLLRYDLGQGKQRVRIRKQLPLCGALQCQVPSTHCVTVLKGRGLTAALHTLYLCVTALHSQDTALSVCVLSSPTNCPLLCCPSPALSPSRELCFSMKTCPYFLCLLSPLVYCLEKYSLSRTNASIRILW